MSVEQSVPLVNAGAHTGLDPAPSAPSAPEATGAGPGGLGRRLTARLIDVGVLFALLGLIFIVTPPTRGVDGPGLRYQGLILGYLALVVLYEFVMVRLLGWTVGKLILGLRVVSIYGGKIGWLQSAGRVYVPRIADTCTFGIGGFLFTLSPLFDDSPWRRGWHDRIASSVVVRSRGPIPTGPQGPVPWGGVAVAPAVHAGIVSDGAMVGALEAYGRREMAGEDPWTPQTTPLARLRETIPAMQGRAEAGRILDELMMVARLSPWHAIGVWRFVAAHGLPPWRKTALPTIFLDALKQILSDPASPAIAYRFDSFEVELVQGREPSDSPLRGLLRSEDGAAS